MNENSRSPLPIMPTVLLLEDNQAYRELIAEVLRMEGFVVHAVADPSRNCAAFCSAARFAWSRSTRPSAIVRARGRIPRGSGSYHSRNNRPDFGCVKTRTRLAPRSPVVHDQRAVR